MTSSLTRTHAHTHAHARTHARACLPACLRSAPHRTALHRTAPEPHRTTPHHNDSQRHTHYTTQAYPPPLRTHAHMHARAHTHTHTHTHTNAIVNCTRHPWHYPYPWWPARMHRGCPSDLLKGFARGPWHGCLCRMTMPLLSPCLLLRIYLHKGFAVEKNLALFGWAYEAYQVEAFWAGLLGEHRLNLRTPLLHLS